MSYKRNNISVVVVILAVSLGVAACGTLINGSREEVTIMTAPSDATIVVESQFLKTGFFRGRFNQGTSHLIEVSKEGYRSMRIRTGNSVSEWYFANFLSFSLPGMIADLISGGAFSINPNPVLVQLSPGSGTPIEEIYDLNGYVEAIVPSVIVFGLVVLLAVGIARGGGSAL